MAVADRLVIVRKELYLTAHRAAQWSVSNRVGYHRCGVYVPNGTIGIMKDHRIRLTSDDLELIVASLRARAAMAGPLRRHRIERLAARLAENVRGNPKLSLGELEQTHEEDLDADE